MVTLTVPRIPATSVSGKEDTTIPTMIKMLKGEMIITPAALLLQQSLPSSTQRADGCSARSREGTLGTPGAGYRCPAARHR